MKNLLLAVILLGLTTILSLGTFAYCETYVCLSGDLHTLLGDFPVPQDVQFVLDDKGELQGVVELQKSIPYQHRFDIRLATEKGLFPISVEGKYVYFNAEDIQNEQDAYFLWQGLKTPAFTIPEPYFTLKTLQFMGKEAEGYHFLLEGDFPFEIQPVLVAESGNQPLEVQAVGNGLEFYVNSNPPTFDLYFEWGELRSKLVSVSFLENVSLDKMPTISGVTSDSGFLPTTLIQVQGKNLPARGVDNPKLELKWSDPSNASVQIDSSLDPGETVKFRLLTAKGWTNPVQFKVAELNGTVELLPQILAVSVVTQDKNSLVLDLYGQNFPKTMETAAVWFEGSPLNIVSVKENRLRVQMFANDNLKGEFRVIRDARFPSEAFPFSLQEGVGQRCDISVSNSCIFLDLN